MFLALEFDNLNLEKIIDEKHKNPLKYTKLKEI